MVVLAVDSSYQIDDEFSRLDLTKLHALLSREFWCAGATREDITTRARNAWAFGMYAPSGELVGFCRLITDRCSFAYLSDVVVEEALRGKGLGSFMLKVVLGLPEIERCKGCLYTGSDERAAYYARWGFYILGRVPASFGERLVMERLSKAERSRTPVITQASARVPLRAFMALASRWLGPFLVGATVGIVVARRRS